MFTDLSIIDYCLFAALAVVMLYQLYFIIRYVGGILFAKDNAPVADADKPGVTVIVCARNEQANLDVYLQSLLTQDYPTFEVIVVDDGSEDATTQVVESYLHQDNRVHRTFVPRDAHVGSTKKLGITLAAKAAQYDYLLMTDADCRPESRNWISAMMSGFAKPETDIVLGYGAYFQRHTFLSDLIHYDTLVNGLHYLGAAQTRKPYMGVGRNLAYRKQFFFATGGFTQLMTFRSGDDDLLVNRNANRNNTNVVVTPDSVTWSLPKESWHEWLQQKRRHLSVSPHYSARSKAHLAWEPLSRGLFYLLLILIAIFCGPLGWIVAASAYVLRVVMLLIFINLGAGRLNQNKVGIETLLLDIILPLLSLFMLISQPFRKVTRW